MVSACEGERLVVRADNARVNSALVLARELLCGEVGGDDGGEASVAPRVNEVVERRHRHLIYILGTEVVEYEKVALEIFVTLVLAVGGACAEAVVLKSGDYILRRVI